MENRFQIGQLITTYYAGYFEVTRTVRRWKDVSQKNEHYQNAYCISGEYNSNCGEEINPIIYFIQRYDTKGNPKKSKEKSCDSSFCKPAVETLNVEIQSLQETLNKLSNLNF